MTDDDDGIPDHIHAFEDDPTYSGVVLIARERQRQLDEEGWTHEHDARHTAGQLARAAATYAMPMPWRSNTVLRWLWPFHLSWYRPAPTDNVDQRVHELAKAGALIAAEIDRLRRRG